MENNILLKELLNDGVLTADLAKKTLQEASVSRKDAEDLLYERRLADEAAVAKTKSRVLKVPYKEVKAEELKDEVLKVVPEESVKNYKIIPISKTPDLLVAGMVNPDDPKAQDALKFIAKQLRVNLGVYLINNRDWESVLRKYSSYRGDVENALKSLNFKGKNLGGGQRIIKLEEETGVSEDAPIIKIVASTLKEAVYQKASDVHIEPQRNEVRIRFRIDGDLEKVASLPVELHQPIVSRVKVMANLKLDETRVPQDGRFRTVLLGRDIDFRVATFPTSTGEKVAIRVLDPTIGLKGMEALGLEERSMKIIREGIERPYGMVLITGPTGSGKSTTLYALMQILNKDNVNIVSLEDPVEYYMDGLNQSQVRPEINYDFASGLRQILRQDPDIIMVGEIRDEETAGLAVHAALTGHVVLSTLHTNNSLGVIPRLIDMKVDAFLLPSALNLMIAQRLISRLCDNCKKSEVAPPEVQGIIKKNLAALPKEILEGLKTKIKNIDGPYETYHAPGCEACKGKGIIGRVALFEVLSMTRELQEVISSGANEHKILEEAKRQGMVDLRQDGILKALEGLVSIEEVVRETTEIY
ncbi:MAG: GspE/PulE family protein [Candidatus Wolfebacteria bacterium]|nr:GspE/PulE family protein [Candidatus Wolfebacteria bacterium]